MEATHQKGPRDSLGSGMAVFIARIILCRLNDSPAASQTARIPQPLPIFCFAGLNASCLDSRSHLRKSCCVIKISSNWFRDLHFPAVRLMSPKIPRISYIECTLRNSLPVIRNHFFSTFAEKKTFFGLHFRRRRLCSFHCWDGNVEATSSDLGSRWDLARQTRAFRSYATYSSEPDTLSLSRL